MAEGELPPEPVGVREGPAEEELDLVPSLVVWLPHCSSRASLHWNCWARLLPVALMHVLNHSRQTWPGTVCS